MRINILFLLILTILITGQAFGQIKIDSNRELFIDDYLFDKVSNLKLQLHHPESEGPVFYFDKPWEGNFSAYCTVIKDGTRYLAYYRGVRLAGNDGNQDEVTCYAESVDGITWRKPELGIHEVNGTKKNNVILANAAPITHNFSPFIDKNPEALSSQRFKALGGVKTSGLVALTSADGIHWEKMQEDAVFTDGIFDSQNVSFWSESEQNYVCYFRTWSGEGYTGFRSVSKSTSKDFIHWTKPQKMSFGDTPFEHLYTQQTSPYFRAPHIYVAIGARFMPGRKVVSDAEASALNVNPKYYNDCSDAVFMSSRGGYAYDRTFMESFIKPGIGLSNWVSRSNYPALNVVQTGDEEMSVYVNENYAQESAHLKRYSMRIDGFASLTADYDGGELVTKPFVFKGKELEINYSTSAAGFVKIELQDDNGNAIPGFTMDVAQEIIGNEIKRLVSWEGNTDVSSLSGKSVRMRISMKDSDLFSFKFN